MSTIDQELEVEIRTAEADIKNYEKQWQEKLDEAYRMQKHADSFKRMYTDAQHRLIGLLERKLRSKP